MKHRNNAIWYGVLLACFLFPLMFCTASMRWKEDKRPRPSSTEKCRTNQTAYAVVVVAAVGQGHTPLKPPVLWASVANKRSYVMKHGYALYVVPSPLTHRPTAWDKVVALQAVLRFVRYLEWIWLVDADTLITNMDIDLDYIVVLAAHHKQLSGKVVDVILSCDNNGINTGSMFLRRSNWTLSFLDTVWNVGFKTDVPNLEAVWEQAAIRFLYDNDKSVADHVLLIPQPLINAFPPPGADAHLRPFKDGDLLLHLVAGHKDLLMKFSCNMSVNMDASCPTSSRVRSLGYCPRAVYSPDDYAYSILPLHPPPLWMPMVDGSKRITLTQGTGEPIRPSNASTWLGFPSIASEQMDLWLSVPLLNDAGTLGKCNPGWPLEWPLTGAQCN